MGGGRVDAKKNNVRMNERREILVHKVLHADWNILRNARLFEMRTVYSISTMTYFLDC